MAKKAHLIGICGAGMSAVAHLLKAQGYEVSGSDEGFYPPVSDYLEKLQIPCITGYRRGNIPPEVDLIVIGKNAKLIPETNPEVAEALNEHREIVKSFPEVLRDLTDENDRVVIVGSYGKSTLTSIIAWCLVHAGKDPGYFIGAVPKNLDTSSALGSGEHFIFEGDEYPSANWDQRSKFMHYDPQIVILTSASHDHVNIFPTLEDYHAPFKDLLEKLSQQQGLLIACLDEPNARDFYEAYPAAKVSYGLSGAVHWKAQDIVLGKDTSFRLVSEGKRVAHIRTSMLGRHNIQNIVGAAAYLIGENELEVMEFTEAIEAFQGLTRRLDLKSKKTTLPIYEGFGSSYEKARSAITAIREHFPDRKLAVMFEPHTFTWRNRNALSDYETAFDDTDTVWLYAPATQGAASHEQLSLDEIRTRVSDHHGDVRVFDKKSYTDIVDLDAPEDHVLLILSSGSFDGLLQQVIEQAEQKLPAL